MVRTERFSTSQLPFHKVLLYRNPIPLPLRTYHNSAEYDDDVSLNDYTSFQNYGDIPRTSREKIKIFHTPYLLFGDKFSTDEPSEKLFQFSFEPFVYEEKQRIPRASIYFYENINPGGTCIPFRVGLSSTHDKLLINISELEIPPGSNYLTDTWTINLSSD